MVQALCIGFACYDFTWYLNGFPEEDRKIFVDRTAESGGGPAANAAYLLSSWGVVTAFAGCLGEDREAEAVLEEFRCVGTDVSLVLRAKDYRTPFTTILVNTRRGTRTVLTRHAAPPPHRPDWTRLSGTPIIILADGHQADATIEARDRFPEAALVLDAGSLRDGTRILLPRADYALCSEAFGAALIGRPALNATEYIEAAVSAVQAACPGRVAITLGERGLAFAREGKTRRLPAFAMPAVDTTAAGDIFHGAFAFALLRKNAFRDALVFAQSAAALSVARLGGRASIPAPAEVDAFLAQRTS